MSTHNILFAGGSTGGHIFPIKTLIQFLLAKDSTRKYEIYRSGESGSLESHVCKELQTQTDNIHFLPIYAGKRRRQKDLGAQVTNILDTIKILIGVVQSLYVIKRYRISTVFSKGGYVALPVVIAAKLLHIPLYVHESDTALGLTNRFAARFAQELFVSYPNLANDATLVGQLISEDMLVTPSADTIKHLSLDVLDTDKTTVVVTGGSLGAKTLYAALVEALEKTPELEEEIQFLIVGGLLNKDIKAIFAKQKSCLIYGFLSPKELNALYTVADVAITRAGSTSLAELKLHNLLLCIVPLPRTHDQLNNGRYYADTYGDILIEQNKTTASAFQKTLTLLQDYKKGAQRNEMLKDQARKTKQTIAESLQKASLL